MTAFKPVSRRDLLRLAGATPLLTLTARAWRQALAGPSPDPSWSSALAGPLPDLDAFVGAPSRVVHVDASTRVDRVRLSRVWDGPVCRSEIFNAGSDAMRIREIVLFEVSHTLPPDAALYGEGFQMLSQTGGTVGRPSISATTPTPATIACRAAWREGIPQPAAARR